jgi:sulfatase maturation enzyme AslB (radical SAM superfamily)
MQSGKDQSLSLDIALTSNCLLNCRYCSVEKKLQEELPAKQWKEVISSFGRLRPIGLISLEGGEPYMRFDLCEILAFCLDYAQTVKIVTSGVIPFHSLPVDLLHHPRFILELSLDGPREIHDFLRDNSWEKAWDFLAQGLAQGVRMRLRSVISRYNIFIFEQWLKKLDTLLKTYGQKVEFSFDTIVAPESLWKVGGDLPRAALRYYPTQGLLPSPGEMWKIFFNLKKYPFQNLELAQNEPMRGCGAARGGLISFDPAGNFSFCCEAPMGIGSRREFSADQCLSMLDSQMVNRPCRECNYYHEDVCNGCWTGQKCGMVNYWKAKDCRSLHDLILAKLAPLLAEDPARNLQL